MESDPGDQADVQTLHDLIDRLARQDIVAGILLMGTTGTPELTSTSDYDLLLVFSQLSVPLRIVTTWIDGRLTEVCCTTTRAVERVAAAPGSGRDGSEEGALVNWLRDGRLVHDRDGRLTILRERVRREPPPAVATDGEIYEARRKIAHNVAQLERYLAADDPASNVAADLRLLYSLFEVAVHYFTVHRLPWSGQKPAVRLLAGGAPPPPRAAAAHAANAAAPTAAAKGKRASGADVGPPALAAAPSASAGGLGETATLASAPAASKASDFASTASPLPA